MNMLIRAIDLLFSAYTVLLLIRILASWVPEWTNNRFMNFVTFYTDPYLNLFRSIIPPIGMLDISPIIAFLCLGILEKLIKYFAVLLLS
jgi:YggT family protein